MSDNENMACYVCAKCRDNENNNKAHKCDDATEYKCNKWLQEQVMPEDDESVTTEETSGFTDTQSEISDAGNSFQIIPLNGERLDIADHVNINTGRFKNIHMTKCTNVQLGTVAKIYGSVQINQTVTNVVQNATSTNIFLQGAAITATAKRLNIVDRLNWLAQPPVDHIDRMKKPVKLVIIFSAHTATESSITQAGNVHLVRLAQTFHIESKKWNDIAYNFLVGCDGRVYEGRGWGAVGAHTYGYNQKGIGISFIGCFMNVLPNEDALYQAKALIEHGVKIGEIADDYVLVGHCQCCQTESPGRTLFQEIQTWDHWGLTVPQ